MPKRDISGENNPFYGKKHTQETKDKISHANKGRLAGENNPFYGKNHSKESRQKMSESHKGRFCGEKNPFYGKSHTEESKEKIKEANRIYRENNKEAVLERQLKRLNLTIEKVRHIFDLYKNTHRNGEDIQKEFNVDKRVLYKYMVLLEVCSKEELKEVKFGKKYKNASSSKEEALYEFLCVKFGEENIVRQFNIGAYYYDFLLFGKLLVEYDGYYWHVLVENNDEKKNLAAENAGYKLYRVQENKNRQVNFVKEIKEIERKLNEV